MSGGTIKARLNSEDDICYILLIVVATLCAVLYARSTSIFHPDYYPTDGSMFMHIGQAIKNGYVPYRDIYDTKGPMLWLTEYIGQLICDGRAGIYFLQILNLNAIAVISYKAARYYLTEIWAFISALISIAFIIGTCRLEHTVEEFSYLYSIIAVYITLKNLRSEKSFCMRRDYFIYGATAMCAMLIRVMDCVIAGACIIYAGVMTCKQYGIKKLFVNYAFALLGAAAVLLPFVIYFALNNALWDWLDATVLFSTRYADFNKTPVRFRLLAILLVPISLSTYRILKWSTGLPMLVFAMSFLCGMMYLIVGTTYNHYMTIAVPCVFVCVIQFIVEIKKNKLFINLLFCALFLYSNFMWMYSFASATKSAFEFEWQDPNIVFAENIKSMIGEEDTDSVYTYDTDPAISVVNEYFSRSKFFAAQIQWSQDEQKKNEIYEDFVQGNNTWVIIDDGGIKYGDERILECLRSNYTQVYQYSGIYLYKQKS